MFLSHPRVKLSIVGSLRDREVPCSASDRQSSNFESCVWRTVTSHSSHHPQEVLLAQFSLYVHKGGLKPDSFHFYGPCKHDKYNKTMMLQCWASVEDGGPTIKHHCFNVSCLLVKYTYCREEPKGSVRLLFNSQITYRITWVWAKLSCWHCIYLYGGEVTGPSSTSQYQYCWITRQSLEGGAGGGV